MRGFGCTLLIQKLKYSDLCLDTHDQDIDLYFNNMSSPITALRANSEILEEITNSCYNGASQKLVGRMSI